MPDLKTYDVFVSHSWDYNSDYYSLIEKFNEHPNFKFRNYSVPQHDALNIKTNYELLEALHRQIKPVNAVIVLGGMYVDYRKWIQEEIDIARYYNKPIIAVRPRGAQRMPQELCNVANVVVNWNSDSIIEAIRNYSL